MHDTIVPYVVGPVHPTTWAVQVTPLPGESRSSWILRALRKNMVGPVAFFRESFRLDLDGLDLDFDELPEVMNYFSSRTGIPLAKISGLVPTLPFQATDKGARTFGPILGKTTRGSYNECVNGPRFCPACLATDPDPYFRGEWRVGFVSACFTHNCLLENKCPQCHSVRRPYLLNWRNPLTRCHNCGFDLSKIPPAFISPHDQCWDTIHMLRENPSAELFEKLYFVMLFLLQHCAPSDPVFNGNLLASSERLLGTWPSDTSRQAGKKALQQPIVIYLLCGPAFSLVQDPASFEKFLHDRQQLFRLEYMIPHAAEGHIYIRRVNRRGDVLICGTIIDVGLEWRRKLVQITRVTGTFHVSSIDNRYIATIPEYSIVDTNVDGKFSFWGRTYTLRKVWAETQVLVARSKYYVRVCTPYGDSIAVLPITEAKREPPVMLKINLSDPARKIYRRHVYRNGTVHVRGKILLIERFDTHLQGRDVLITEEGGFLHVLDTSGRWVTRLPPFRRLQVNRDGLFYLDQRIFTLGWQWRHDRVLVEYGVKCLKVYDMEQNFLKLILLKDGILADAVPEGFFDDE